MREYGLFGAGVGLSVATSDLDEVLELLLGAYPVAWRGNGAEAYASAVTTHVRQVRAIEAAIDELRSVVVLAQNAAAAELMERAG